MITFRRCFAEHLKYIKPQSAQSGVYNAPIFDEIVGDSVALSTWVDECRCIAAAGVYTIWDGRGIAWALLSDEAGQHMLPITRRMKIVLKRYPARRIEMNVVAGFNEGHRFAQLLGFHCETPNGMTYFYEDGRGAFLYAMVKSWP